MDGWTGRTEELREFIVHSWSGVFDALRAIYSSALADSYFDIVIFILVKAPTGTEWELISIN